MASRDSKRPNIVYIIADQQKASATSVYGNNLVPTPFTDHMAANGITFRDAYTPSTICTPSRASVFTGVHPLVHQVTCWQNKAPWNLPQMSEMFADSGYYTAAVGHYELGRNLGRGWHEQSDLWEMGPLLDATNFKYSHGRTDCGWSSGALDCKPEEGQSAVLANRAIKMLDNAVDAGAPFFLHVSFNDPHPPYFVPPPYDSIVDPDKITLPDFGNDDGRPAWQHEALKAVNTAAASSYDVKKVIATYYGMIACVDAQMKRIHDALASHDLLENTWIVFSADHGDFAGEKGLFMKCEVPYECLLHVPLIIVPPSGMNAPRDKHISGLVQTADLFSTMLTLAGIDVPDYAQTKDLLGWVGDGANEPLHECLFAQVGDYHGHLKDTLPKGTYEAGRRKALLQNARTSEFSYIRDSQWGDEAYDLRTDPTELSNVINDNPKSTGKEPAWVGEMRRRTDNWEEECLKLREKLGVIPGDRGFD